MKPCYLIIFGLGAATALICALLYRKRRADRAAYKKGYDAGIRLLLGRRYDAYVWTLPAGSVNTSDAYTRGLYKALEDDK